MGEPDTGPEQLHEERPRNLPSLAETHLESKPYYREFGDGLSQFGARRRVEGGDFVGKKMLENFNTARVALSSRKWNKNSRNSRKLTYFEKRIWTNLRSMHRILQSTTFLPNRITERQSPEPCSDEQTAGYDTANFPSNGLERLLRKVFSDWAGMWAAIRSASQFYPAWQDAASSISMVLFSTST